VNGVLRILSLLAVALGLLALAAPAGAASRNQIIRDCEDDSKLSGNYSNAELRDARNNLPSDTDAYSDCRDVLSSALARKARERSNAGGGGTGPSGGSTLGTGAVPGTTGAVPGSTCAPGAGGGASSPSPFLDIAPGAAPPKVSPEERASLREARRKLPEVEVRGQRVVPGVQGVAGAAASSPVPTSLVVVLALLGVSVLLAAVSLARRRVLARRAV